MNLETFLDLPDEEMQRIVRQNGRKVCVFPINGTRRWFLLEHSHKAVVDDPIGMYMDETGRQHIELYRMIFDQGVDTVLSPMFGADLLDRGEVYIERVGAEGLARLASHPDLLAFYDEYQVRVRFYGDYHKYLIGTPYSYLSDLFDQVTQRTLKHERHRLFFGVFASEATETIATLAIQYYRKTRRSPVKKKLIEMYYGEDVEPVSFFIGFDKFCAFDMPMLATGNEDLYFTVAPSLYLTKRQLREILYDHLFSRRCQDQDYNHLPVEEKQWMRAFYQSNQERTFGVGMKRENLWYPVMNLDWPEPVPGEGID